MRTGSWWRLLALSIVAALIVAACGGGDDDDAPADDGDRPTTEEPTPDDGASLAVPIDADLLAAFEAVVAIPETPDGASDAEGIRALIGPPDTFEISYELIGGEDEASGEVVRFETWVYYDLLTAFEFADGVLIASLPVDDLDGPGALPIQYDPDDFARNLTWDDVSAMLVNPEAAAESTLPDDLGVTLTLYAAEQLLVAFDADGLAYAETFPIESPDPLNPGGSE